MQGKKKDIKRIVTICFLTVILVFILSPIYWAIELSFDADAVTGLPDFRLLPEEFTIKFYKYAFESIPLLRYFANTMFLTVVNTTIAVFFAMVCGYAFAKLKFCGKKVVWFLLLVVMMMPFESRMIPLYLMYNSWGMINTYWPLILNNFCYVFGIFFASQSISSIPDSLRESAWLDGSGEWRIFFKIILPLSKPIISALSILQIVAQWNSYLWPMVVIRSKEKQVISVGVSLFNAGEDVMYYGPRIAVALLGSIPLIAIYLILQRYIVESIALTGIK